MTATRSTTWKLTCLLIDSLLKSDQGLRAQIEFKRLFSNTNLSPFLKIVPRPALAGLLNGLNEDFWFDKFSFLLKNGAKAEFRQELPYCRFRSLARLFRAEFAYLDRDYAQSRSLLRDGLDERYRPFAEKILLKIAVRQDPQADIADRLQAIRENSAPLPGIAL